LAEKRVVLVTGGAGYIGSQTCKALASENYFPVTYDNLEYGHRWAVKWGPLEYGDIADRVRLSEVIRKYRPEGVIHFAAYAYVGESVEYPAKYYRNNVAGTLTLLESMREYGIDKIVFSSSCATYGIPGEVPITETTAREPINPYGWSKLMIERMLADFEPAYGIRHIILRYFNAAGADLEGDIGEVHTPETHLIPRLFSATNQGCPPITVYGDDYDTYDGTCIRDYIHVTDLADAHICALEYLNGHNKSEAINLGKGEGYSIKEVIKTTESIIGREIPFIIGHRRQGDPPLLIAAVDKAKQLLGWKAKGSNLENIIQTAWNWHNSRRQKSQIIVVSHPFEQK